MTKINGQYSNSIDGSKLNTHTPKMGKSTNLAQLSGVYNACHSNVHEDDHDDEHDEEDKEAEKRRHESLFPLLMTGHY